MRFSRAVLLCIPLVSSCPITCGQSTSSAAESLAIVHATAYIDPGAAPVENATIIVAEGKIQAAAAGLPVPPGMRVLDAHAAIVTPGLMNSDSQLGLLETGTEETNDPAVRSGPLGAAFDVEYALNANSTLLPVARADGLTRAVVLPTGSANAPFDGLGAILRLEEGPEILDRPKAVEVAEVGGMAVPLSGGSRAAQWQLIRRALDAARESSSTASSSQGTDPFLSRANLEALNPVLAGRIPLAIIASRESDLRQAVALAREEKIRVVVIGAEEGWRVADLLAAQHIAVVLDPYASGPATYDQIGARSDNAALLDDAGVVVSFKAAFVHVSYNAGIALRIGAGIAVANGLPRSHALRALTSNAAQTWGIADHYGTLRPGQDADLVVWDGDPLEAVSNPVAVLVRGKRASLETRQTQLEKRYRPQKSTDPLPPAYRK